MNKRGMVFLSVILLSLLSTPGTCADNRTQQYFRSCLVTIHTLLPGPVPLSAMAGGMVSVIDTTDNRGSRDGFSAQLWLVPDSEAFFERMQNPDAPLIPPSGHAVRGRPLETAVIFQNPLAGEDGKLDVTYDIEVHRPDGSLYGRVPDLEGVDEVDGAAPLQPGALRLGDGLIQIVIEPHDPGGIYRVQATVTDNNRHLSLELNEWFVIDE